MFCQPMSPSEPVRIFISYARKDGADLARRLQADLEKNNFDAWLDTNRLVGGRVWSNELERAIDTRHLILGPYPEGVGTDEPLLQAVASPSVTMERYTSGFTLAESLYAASRFVGWEDVVIGDPLCGAPAWMRKGAK